MLLLALVLVPYAAQLVDKVAAGVDALKAWGSTVNLPPELGQQVQAAVDGLRARRRRRHGRHRLVCCRGHHGGDPGRVPRVLLPQGRRQGLGLDLPGRQRPEARADHGGRRRRPGPRERLPPGHDAPVRDHRHHRPRVHAGPGDPPGRATRRPRLLQRLHPLLRRHRRDGDHPAGDLRGAWRGTGRPDAPADRRAQRHPGLPRPTGGLRANREHSPRGGAPVAAGRLRDRRDRRPVRRGTGHGRAARGRLGHGGDR